MYSFVYQWIWKLFDVSTLPSLSLSYSSNEQQIVFLCGPGKTGTSSTQHSLYHWIKMGLLPNWSFPIPRQYKYLRGKGFAPLMRALRNATIPVITSNGTTRNKIKNKYRKYIYNAWYQGKSLVIASEIGWRRKGVLQKIVAMMPSVARSNMVFEVNYRWPRVSHLISLWHQWSKDMLLSEWIMYSNGTQSFRSSIDVLDPIGLAQSFVYGAPNSLTVIIDMSGVAQHGYDISFVIICDVLNVKCKNHTFTNAIDYKALSKLHLNKRGDGGAMDLSVEQISDIEDILNRLDCKYVALTRQRNVKILYQHQLFSKCDSQYFTALTRDEAIKAIIEVVGNDINKTH